VPHSSLATKDTLSVGPKSTLLALAKKRKYKKICRKINGIRLDKLLTCQQIDSKKFKYFPTRQNKPTPRPTRYFAKQILHWFQRRVIDSQDEENYYYNLGHRTSFWPKSFWVLFKIFALEKITLLAKQKLLVVITQRISARKICWFRKMF
jgi:hypothetical protein